MKTADLYPPLGANGGPCRVVDRILSRGLSEDLVQEVEHGTSLSNPEAQTVYKQPLRERTSVSPILPYVISPHAQYRMDLRGVTIKDLSTGISEFFATLQKIRAKSETDFQVELRDRLARGWVSTKGLFLKLAVHQGDPIVVTTFWNRVPDPTPPAEGCHGKVGGTQPLGDLSGYRTVVDEKPAKGINDSLGDTINHPSGESPKSDRERAKPEPTDTKENLEQHPAGNWSYNAPGPSEPGSKMHVRSPGTPGEEYGHPYKENIMPRRTEAGLYPAYSDRQHDQKGQAKKYYERYYRRNKGKIRMRAERMYKRLRKNPEFLRVKSRRQDKAYAPRYKRLPSGGYRSNKERAQESRDNKKAFFPVTFYHKDLGPGSLDYLEDTMVVFTTAEGTNVEDYFDFLGDVGFDTEEGLTEFFSLSDAVFEGDPSKVAGTFYRETFKPGDNMDPGPGAQDLGEPSPYNPSLTYPDTDRNDRPPAHLQNDIHEVEDNPGSAKVIPSGKGFVNKEAKGLSDILSGTSAEVGSRAQGLKPKVSHFGKTKYTFVVPGDTDTYKVSMSVDTPEGATFSGSDFRVSCTCNFWRWQGPEHWAKVGGYLYGNPRGTAGKPTHRDPDAGNRVCKHVMAVLSTVRKWGDNPPR